MLVEGFTEEYILEITGYEMKRMVTILNIRK